MQLSWNADSETGKYMYMDVWTSDKTSVEPYEYRVRVPKIEVSPWIHVEEPFPGGIIRAEQLTEPIKALREEFNQKLETMMNQMLQQVMEIIALLPRGGYDIPARKGVLCFCGNFIPEEKIGEKCEFCGK